MPGEGPHGLPPCRRRWESGIRAGGAALPRLGGVADEVAPDRRLDEPHPDRLPLDHPHRAAVLAAHSAALREGEPGYVDPVTGLYVFTAAYLADRGTCCHSGCRHCPYVV